MVEDVISYQIDQIGEHDQNISRDFQIHQRDMEY
jgi:hypothetical protein